MRIPQTVNFYFLFLQYFIEKVASRYFLEKKNSHTFKALWIILKKKKLDKTTPKRFLFKNGYIFKTKKLKALTQIKHFLDLKYKEFIKSYKCKNQCRTMQYEHKQNTA